MCQTNTISKGILAAELSRSKLSLVCENLEIQNYYNTELLEGFDILKSNMDM